jgi:hypothetical protein
MITALDKKPQLFKLSLHGSVIEKKIKFPFFSCCVSTENAILFMQRSLNHVVEKWKKIIQFGKSHELIWHFT